MASSLVPATTYRGVAAWGLAALGGAALSFVVFVGAISSLQEHRAQLVSYVDLRNALALGTEPVSALVPAGTPIALLQIPELRLSEVVLQGTTGGTLMEGPGHLRTSVLPGQAGTSILLGRRTAFGGPFRDIGSLPRGAEIVTTTGQGVARYRVTDVRRSDGPAEGLPPGPSADSGALELTTAAGPAYLPSGVISVDAVLEQGSGPGAGSVAGPPFLADAPLAAVGPDEAALAGDTAATVPLALWSQLLLVVGLGLSVTWTRFGRAQTWLVGAPVVVAIGWQVAEAAARLLPNLL